MAESYEANIPDPIRNGCWVEGRAEGREDGRKGGGREGRESVRYVLFAYFFRLKGSLGKELVGNNLPLDAKLFGLGQYLRYVILENL
jgi:hypothetical protein